MRDGRSLTLGAGGAVLVDAAELVAAGQRLRVAEEGLEAAGGRLGAAAWQAELLSADLPEARVLAGALEELCTARWGPRALARDTGDLASRLRDAAAAYDLAETDAQARWGRVLGAAGIVAAASPLGPVLLTSAAGGVAVGDLLLGEARDLVRDPWSALSPAGVRADVERLLATPHRIVDDGRAARTLQLLAAALASLGGAAPAGLDPVRRFTAHVARLLPARDVRLVPRTDPPALPAPRGVGDLVDLVARTYDEDTPTGEPGTPLATVTVQRLDHADGTRAWVVAVPGTRAAGLTGDVPTDNGTNLALAGGVPDVMTRAVVEAMADAGIAADEPVALVGHSQGGMVATNVAAATAGAYAVRLVVTAGSPDVPAAPPPGVATVTLRHREDAVSVLDGRVGERGGPRALSVVRDLAATGGPPRPSFVEAHAVSGYVRTGALVDDALTDLPADDPVRRALGEVLGEGAAAVTTTQVTVEVVEEPEPTRAAAPSRPGPRLGAPALGEPPQWPPRTQVPWSAP
ncbi:hypothetical protein [Cellulomonas flavigena]|uniref:hypothetical protein n=1 Tax=Cellulomonas flavigena TaxID=1711 RepID=UPI0011D19AA9|nr:hypothetical protein [Cellulomonas flavigena]